MRQGIGKPLWKGNNEDKQMNLEQAVKEYHASVPTRDVVNLVASLMTPAEALDYVASWRKLERRLSTAVSEARRKERLS